MICSPQGGHRSPRLAVPIRRPRRTEPCGAHAWTRPPGSNRRACALCGALGLERLDRRPMSHLEWIVFKHTVLNPAALQHRADVKRIPEWFSGVSPRLPKGKGNNQIDLAVTAALKGAGIGRPS